MLQVLLERGLDLALSSNVRSKHVCFVVSGKNVVNFSINRYSNSFYYTEHAEELALTKNIHPKFRKGNCLPYKGADIYIFRFKKDKYSGRYIIANSKPCLDCTKIIQNSGIKNVYYTLEEDGKRGVIKVRASKLQTICKSRGRRRIRNL